MNNLMWGKYLRMRGEQARDIGEINKGHREYTLDEFGRLIGKADGEKKMLVVGCSTGAEVKYMMEEYGFDAHGIDFDDSQFGKVPEVKDRLMKMDMHCMELPNNEFDIIYCCHTLEHALAPFIVLCEFNRVLKIGGMVFISIPRLTPAWLRDNQHISVLTKEQLEHMAEKLCLHMSKYILTRLPKHKEDDKSQIFILEKISNKGLK